MKKFLKAASFFLLFAIFSMTAWAEGETWAQLNTRVADLFQKGQYVEAIPVAEEALKSAEATFGSDSAETALSLNNLGLIYKTQKRYSDAEPLYERALLISEKLVGPEHPDLTVTINNLAFLYYAEGKYAKGDDLCARAIAILEKAYGPDHPNVAVAQEKYASLKRQVGKT